jgi:hypothetical protein
MSTTPKSLIDGVGLTNAYPGTPQYTVPANTKTRILEIIVANNHTVAVTVDINFVPAGGSPDYTNAVFIGDATNGLILAAKESRVLPFNTVLSAGATIQAKASITTVVGMRGSGIEMVG